MASINKRGKTWQVVVSVPENGQYRRKTKGGFKTKKDAERWAFEIEIQKHNGQRLISASISLADYFKMWYEQNKRGVVRDSTYLGYELVHSFIDRYLPNATLEKLSKFILQDAFDRASEHYSKSTLKRFWRTIKLSLVDAVDDNLMAKLPAQRLIVRGKPSKDADLKFLEADEYERLHAYLYTKDDLYSLAILIALETGARLGEVVALSADTVNTNFNTITIQASYSMPSNRVTEPKSKSSYRTLKITPALSAQIARVCDLTHGGYLFTNLQKTGISTQFRDVLRRISLEINIKVISFHGLRHSFASYLLANGVEVAQISRQLGHSSITVTLDVYSHVLKSYAQAGQEKSVEILSRNFQQFSTSAKSSG